MKYIEALFLVAQAHAMRAHAEIVSGAYKLSKKQVGVVGGGNPDIEGEAQDAVALFYLSAWSNGSTLKEVKQNDQKTSSRRIP